MSATAQDSNVLLRLNYVDAKELIHKTKLEKLEKEKEMQIMVGGRYHELLEAADSIVTMHQSTIQLKGLLDNLPDQLRLLQTLRPVASDLPKELSFDQAPETLPSEPDALDQIESIISSSEAMWIALDIKEPLQALLEYQRVQSLYHSATIQDSLDEYPFLRDEWESIREFPERIRATAIECMQSQQHSANFYKDALSVSIELENLSKERCLDRLLTSRRQWVIDTLENDTLASVEAQLCSVLTSVIDTICHVAELNAREHSFWEHLPLQMSFSTWLQQVVSRIWSKGKVLLKQIDSTQNLTTLQQKLNSIIHERFESTSVYLDGSLKYLIDTKFLDTSTRALSPEKFDLWRYIFERIFVQRIGTLLRSSYTDIATDLKDQVLDHLAEADRENGAVDEAAGIIRHPHLHALLRGHTILQTFSDKLHEIAQDSVRLNSHMPESSVSLALREQCSVMLLDLSGFFSETFCRTTYKTNRDVLLFSVQLASGIAHGVKILDLLLRSCAEIKKKPHKPSQFTLEELYLAHAKYRGDAGVAPYPELVDELEKMLQADLQSWKSSYSFDTLDQHQFCLLAFTCSGDSCAEAAKTALLSLAQRNAHCWSELIVQTLQLPVVSSASAQDFSLTDEHWRSCEFRWEEVAIVEEEESGEDYVERVALPYCESPALANFLFSLNGVVDHLQPKYFSNDMAMIQNAWQQKSRCPVFQGVLQAHAIVVENLRNQAIDSLVQIYQEQLDRVRQFCIDERIRPEQREACLLQWLFDLYFARMVLGNAAFAQFGWGADIVQSSNPSILRLLNLSEELQTSLDPVNWEIYGPSLLELVISHFQSSRLVYSVLAPEPVVTNDQRKYDNIAPHEGEAYLLST